MFVFSSFTTNVFSQSLYKGAIEEYSYVVVPELFEFLREKDQYQLNSLTQYLFEKHGFNAYMESEVPDYKRCNGLRAEVLGKPSMIWTKVTILLKDCNGAEIFRSEVGRSKLKAYNKTYTDALRKAFKSIEALQVQQPEPKLMVSQEEAQSAKISEGIEQDKGKPSREEAQKFAIESATLSTAEYTNNGQGYVLAEHKNSYTLYEGSSLAENLEDRKVKGTITKSKSGEWMYADTSGNKFPCTFDVDTNLLVETSFQTIRFEKLN